MHFDNHLLCILCILAPTFGVVAQYTAIPRWGQAVALVNNALFIHGGKTDPSNSYSYTSAPTSNDILYLPLSTPFDASSPPWQLSSNSSNSTTASGPMLAWHTLSAFNSSALLSFGGDPGPNSATVILDLADSAALLNIFDLLKPIWIPEVKSWANEPIRRIHHSASSSGGKIWLVGGEKDDGSSNALSDHYVFDPNVPSFAQLPSDNGPPDLYGHASIVLPNGHMLVFGGYSQSMGALIPFTTIWAIDTTQSSLTWTSLSISNSSLPSPRRAFAAVLLDDSKILIHGGADAVLQNVYSDGWILDTTQNHMVWSSVAVLSGLGPRYDHFAVATGSQVVFGWGYGPNGPADTNLHLYDPSGNSFVSSFTPAPMSHITTLPIPTQTQSDIGPSGTTHYGSGTSTGGTGPHTGSMGSGTGTKTGSVYPTSTQTAPSRGPNPGSGGTSKNKATTAIAVGTVFGVLALVAGALATAYYVKHHRHYPTGDRLHLLGGEGSEDGDGDARMASVIIGVQEKMRSRPSRWFSGSKKEINNQLGVGLALHDTGPHRRNMFADEDTREFGAGLGYGISRDASGSSWSLHSMGAAIGSIGAGVRGILSGQDGYDHSAHASDPFFGDEVAAVRPHSRRQTSYASTLHSSHDPFASHPVDEATGSDEDESTRLTNTNDISSRTTIPSTFGLHTLAPLTEQSSRTSDPTSSSSSQGPLSSPFDSAPSITSYEYRPQRRSSIINSTRTPDKQLRRSDSWWARFAHTPFLDRRPPERPSRALDIRDPNPAPRLVTIQEASAHSDSSDSPESQAQRNIVSHEHRKSASSLQTAMTADSDVIERMGGMDVIQRDGSRGSHKTNQTTQSTSHDSPDHDASWIIPKPLSIVASSGISRGSQSQTDDERTVESPVEMIPSDLSQKDFASDRSMRSTQRSSTNQPISRGSDVLGRIHAYERRISQNAEAVSSSRSPISFNARNTRKREEFPSKNRSTINYGLAPRPPLFVANPDHKASPSSES